VVAGSGGGIQAVRVGKEQEGKPPDMVKKKFENKHYGTEKKLKSN
jgi:hypothetical protein